jgi:hypothetical protein
MALHNTIIGNLTNINLNTHIGTAGPTFGAVITQESASVLFRIVSLVALTHRERNPLAGGIIWYQKLFSAYDCLFPFSNNGLCFPDERRQDNIDLNVANGEFGVVVGGGTTAAEYIGFMNAAAGAGGRGATALGVANTAVGGPIPVIDENITVDQISTIFNDYAVARNVANMNFFDEVNVVHNIHKLLARKNIIAVRELRGNAGVVAGRPTRGRRPRVVAVPPATYNQNLKVSISRLDLATTMRIGRTGNLEGAKVDSWGDYQGNIDTRDSFRFFKDVQRGANPANRDEQELLRIFRDLYRLECIREPAALITNAMFADLAMFNANNGYTSIDNTICSFTNIRTIMPMAPKKTVQATRRIWKDIMLRHNIIYYRYDYIRYSNEVPGTIPQQAQYVLLKQMENNLLFNYIMHQADQLDTANPGAGNITARLRNAVLLPLIVPAAIQQVAFAGGVNPWAVVMGPYPAVIASIYEVTVPVTIAGVNHNIVFQARFPNTGNPIQATDIFITSFPLALINQLLLDWYQVDIGLAAAPNQNIQIDLQLRL